MPAGRAIYANVLDTTVPVSTGSSGGGIHNYNKAIDIGLLSNKSFYITQEGLLEVLNPEPSKPNASAYQKIQSTNYQLPLNTAENKILGSILSDPSTPIPEKFRGEEEDWSVLTPGGQYINITIEDLMTLRESSFTESLSQTHMFASQDAFSRLFS